MKPTQLNVEYSFTPEEARKRALLSQYLCSKYQSSHQPTQQARQLQRSQFQRPNFEPHYSSCKALTTTNTQTVPTTPLPRGRLIRRPKSTSTLLNHTTPNNCHISKPSLLHPRAKLRAFSQNAKQQQIAAEAKEPREQVINLHDYYQGLFKKPQKSQIFQGDNKKASFVEIQKKRIVRRFQKSMTHQKQRMGEIQRQLIGNNTKVIVQKENVKQQQQSRNTKQTGRMMQGVIQSATVQQQYLTTCDTNDAHNAAMRNNTLTTVAYYQTDPCITIDAQNTYQVEPQFSTQPQPILDFNKPRNANLSSNSKCSKRYEPFNPTQSSQEEDPYHSNNNASYKPTTDKILTICRKLITSQQQQKKDNFVILSNDSLYLGANQTIDSTSTQRNHQQPPEEAREAQMSLEIAKKMLQRKREKFLNNPIIATEQYTKIRL